MDELLSESDFVLPKIICGIDVQDHNLKFENFKNDFIQRVKYMAGLFQSISDLANLRHEIYMNRHELVTKKFDLMHISGIVSRMHVIRRKKVIDAYKFGNVKAPGINSAVILKNEDEREVYYSYDLRFSEYFMRLIDSQIDWITATIKSVDDMIYGIPHAIELEKYKTIMK